MNRGRERVGRCGPGGTRRPPTGAPPPPPLRWPQTTRILTAALIAVALPLGSGQAGATTPSASSAAPSAATGGPEGRPAPLDPAEADPEAVVGPDGDTPAARSTGVAATGGVTALSPARLLDSRSGLGARGPVASGASLTFGALGRAGVPASDVRLVTLTVTVPAPTTAGTLTLLPSGGTVPTVAQVRYSSGIGVSTQVWVPVGSDGRVTVRNSGPGAVHVLADAVGYQGTATGAGSYAAVTPSRVVDTAIRLGASGPAPANGSLTATVAGRAGVPAGAAAALISITVPAPTASGWLTVRPAGTTRGASPSSQLNWSSGTPVTGPVLAPLSADGRITVYAQSAAATGLQIDVLGYVRSGAPSAGAVVALPATRIADTRSGLGWYDTGTPLPGHSFGHVQVGGRGGVPQRDVAAVLVQLVAVSPASSGSLTVGGAGALAPDGLVAKFGAGQTRSGLALVPVDSTGVILVGNTGNGGTHLAVDVVGYVPAPPGDAPLQWSAPAATSSGLTGVSELECPTATFCLAAQPDGRSARYDGTAWTPLTGLAGQVYSLSCPADGFCLALRSGNRASAFSDGSWRTVPLPTTGSTVVDASCSAPTFCLAVALDGSAWSWDGSTWTGRAPVYAGADPDYDPTVSEISCSSSTFCAVAGTRDGGWLWNGTTWSTAALVQTSTGFAVDCPTDGFCAAISGYASDAVLYDQGSVRLDAVSWDQWMTDVSCADRTLCVAVGGGQQIATWDGTTWPDPAFPQTVAGTPEVVACPTHDRCIALQRDGRQLLATRPS